VIQKTKVKKMFNTAGLQITTQALNMIEEEVTKDILGMVERTKSGNVKRLTPDLFWVALGRYNTQ